MNVLLTLADMFNIHFCYKVYMEKYTVENLDVDENPIYRETQQLIKTSMNEAIRYTFTAFTPVTIPVTPAQWRTLQEVLSTVFFTHRINPNLTTSAAAYRAILQKLDTYELAAHVEEALTDANGVTR